MGDRREFLRIARNAVIFGALSPVLSCKSKQPQKETLEFILGKENVAKLPNKGFAYIINDLHASFSDYQEFKKQTRFFQRILNGEDLYLVLNGDVVDRKPNHGEKYGDSKILADLREKINTIPKHRQNRIIPLLGNHEANVIQLYESIRAMMQKRSGATRKQIVEVLYSNNSNLKQFNFIERITGEDLKLMKTFKLAAQCANGTIIMHSSYPRNVPKHYREDVLWTREGKGDDFLKRIGAELIINGHTVPTLAAKDNPAAIHYQKKGITVVDKDRVIIAPSFHAGGGGTYLRLDLSKTYKTGADLKLGQEVLRLR